MAPLNVQPTCLAQRPRVWTLLVGLLFLALAGCKPARGTPTPFWLPTLPPPTPSPSPTFPPTSTPAGRVLFADDFSDPQGPWPVASGPWGAMGYANGGYRMAVFLAQTDIWANPGLEAGDVRVEVDALAVSGSEYNSFGVLCRYMDDDNFLFFVLSNAGYYAVVLKKDGEQYQLTSERQFARRDVIRPGGQVNRVQAECVGQTYRLYANDVLLAEGEEPGIPPQGDVGLIAGAFTDAGVVMHFDNFLVVER